MGDVLGLVIFAVVIGSAGVGMIWSGRRGRSNEIDFAMGGHNRANTDPQRWNEMQRTVGRGLTQSGGGYLIAALAPLFIYAFGAGEDASIAPGLILVIFATAWLLRSVARGLTRLS